jgi:hypothetical protein
MPVVRGSAHCYILGFTDTDVQFMWSCEPVNWQHIPNCNDKLLYMMPITYRCAIQH